MSQNKQSVITIHVRRPEDVLFPSPMLTSATRLLNPVVEDSILEQAEGMKVRGDISLVIRAEERNSDSEGEITNCVRAHFTNSRRKAQVSVRRIFDTGWRSLLVSFVFLMVMFSVAFAITTFLPENAVMMTLRELFIIFGWVALWRPADLLLYEWRPINRRGKLLEKLAHCKVIFE